MKKTNHAFKCAKLVTMLFALFCFANFNAVAFAQAPPTITDPFADLPADEPTATTEEEDAPPTLEMAPAAEEPVVEEPPVEEVAPVEEAAPVVTAPAPVTTVHAAAAPKVSSDAGKTVTNSGPEVYGLLLVSILGAAGYRKFKKSF